MATGTRISEDGNRRVAESVAGFSGASSLNDAVVFPLIKETFETTPLTRGWLAGSGWTYNGTNKNMQPV